eukprot:1136163-Pelagomonas_calceolata.AAC.3
MSYGANKQPSDPFLATRFLHVLTRIQFSMVIQMLLLATYPSQGAVGWVSLSVARALQEGPQPGTLAPTAAWPGDCACPTPAWPYHCLAWRLCMPH